MMENHNELLRRAEDLCRRCEKSGGVTHTAFLTPAERAELESWARHNASCCVLFCGGGAESERCAAFFLPDWMDEESFEAEEYLCAIRLTAFFGAPGHRDYMGALLGMGIGREWLGDIQVAGETAWVFCMPSVQKHLLSIDKVGRCTVRAEAVALADVPAPERQVKEKRFSVQSPRLDAVTAGLFSLSRSEAARQIEAGGVSVNYRECLKCDLDVGEGDVISLRGKGKGRIIELGGTSRKGRLFLTGEVFT